MIVSDDVVEPEILPPSVVLLQLVPPFVENCHCNDGVGLPVAAPVNVVVVPTSFVRDSGLNVITGAEFTASEPPLLAVVVPELIASMRNKSPLCAAVTFVTVSVVVVTPE
jgi:hypothetical protein